MRTEAGHHDFFNMSIRSLYHPTFPRVEHMISTPRDPQTLEYRASSWIVRSLRIVYFFTLLAPLHITASVISHAVYPRQVWNERKWKRGYFPNRMPAWTLLQTIWIPLVGSLFWALVYGSPPTQTIGEESMIPKLSRILFGSKYQGWCIEAEAISVPPLPTDADDTSCFNGHHSKDGSEEETPGKHDAAVAAPYQKGDGYNVPTTLLKGIVRGDTCDVVPKAVPSFWLWKSVAAKVKAGKVIAVKPGSQQGGLGPGPAMGPDERMVIYLVGGGYHSGSAITGPLAWTVCRQTGLRILGVNFRKATNESRSFPAALQDALAAWVYVTRRLRFQPENVILMGDSAGAGLCLALQLYLSSLMVAHRGTSRDLGRARKLILHSPFADLTLGTQTFLDQVGVDILSPTMCSFARDNYLRHVISIPGRRNPAVDGKPYGLHRAADIAKRYNLNRQSQSEEQYNAQLVKLANELPETVLELGASHPFFSMALPFDENPYLEQCMQLLKSPPSLESPTDGKRTLLGSTDLEVLITVGTAEVLYDQIKTLSSNLLSLSAPSMAPVLGSDKTNEQGASVKVLTIESLDQHHVYAFFSPPGEVRAEIDEVVAGFLQT